jgi:RNA polymerase sigma factor (sigma-70 family)
VTIGQLNPILHYLHRVGATLPGPGDTDALLLERFTRRGDETAFAALLRRHGPLVLGVCRRVLRDAHEAEDAFQATFLLLVRKAGSLRRPDRLGPWLYGVAYRTAQRARGRAARRRPLPGSESLAAPAAADELLWNDLRPVLDDAIERLPTKYRTPFVLCYLQGMTQAQAALHLGCPPGTVATRLSRARQRLRTRLARHGLGAAVGLLTAGLAARAAPAVPPGVLASAVRAALALSAGPCSAGALSAPVSALLKGVCKAMLMEKVRMAILALAALGAVGSAGVWTYRALATEPGLVAEGPTLAADPPPRIDDVPPPQPVITGLAPTGDVAEPGQTARTPNFLVTAPSRRCARLVAQAAEQQRRLQALLWLVHKLPEWPEPCRVKVKLLASRQAGLLMKEGGGFTTFRIDKGVMAAQEMHLEAPLEEILAKYLPHEVAHTVFASYFGVPIPRWADEAGALLSEDEEEQQACARNVGEVCGHPERIIPLRRLLSLLEYPDRSELEVFYVESYSLTRFLIERKDRPTFLAFVKQGMRHGWDEAVHSHYGFRDVDALEHAWRASLPRPADAPPAAEPQQETGGSSARLPAGPPPTMVLAQVTHQKWVRIRVPVITAIPVTTYVAEPKFEGGFGGTVEPRTSYQIQASERVDVAAVEWVEAFGTDGLRISPKDLVKRLQKEAPVLLSANGQKVDPFYLRFMKVGTVVLVLPSMRPEAPAQAIPPPPGNPVGK